jgi:peptidoglycan hydrolase-like protein with peptidoglycan-binding domain
VQERLNELGYAVKPADGNWGPTSRNALRRFKEANGLLWNDGFDIETVARLFSASATRAINPAGNPAGETGAFETAYAPPPGSSLNPLNRTDAERIQRRLAALGYYTAKGYGLWGTTSRKALRAFKASNDLADDDEWDAMTESVLNDEQGVRVSAAGSDGSGATGSVPPASPGSPARTDAAPKPGVATKPAKRAAATRDDAPRPPATIPVLPAARPPGAGTAPAR